MKPEFTCSPPGRALVCLLASLGTVLLGASLPALADDTSVYAAQLARQQKPNILFVLDYSGSMRENVQGKALAKGDPNAKIAILQRAMKLLLEENKDTVNAGLGSLFGLYAGGVRWPISNLAADASSIDPAIPAGQFSVRQVIEKQLDRTDAQGSTATVNALIDAALYFKGGRVAHDDRPIDEPDLHAPDAWNVANARYQGGSAGAALPFSYLPRNAYQIEAHAAGQVGYCHDRSPSGGVNDCAGRQTYDCQTLTANGKAFNACRFSHPDRWSGKANYETPITQMCQANYIVLISDGEPTTRHVGPAFAEVLGAGGAEGCADLSSEIFGASADSHTYGNCGPEIVRLLNRGDQALVAAVPGSKVSTHTIGFSVAGRGQNYLRRLAREGGGRFFDAEDEVALVGALGTVIDEIKGASENFAELAVDVNRATFSHDDRAYLNLFSPTVNRSWPGNLKGFFVKADGLYDINDNPALAAAPDDAGPADANATGPAARSAYFSEKMQSFWSATPDGNDVVKGGGNESVRAGNRTLYTFTGTVIPEKGARLDQDAHRLIASNDALTAPMLGLPPGSSARTPLLEWLDTAPMGDPLHSKPVRIDYESAVGPGEDAPTSTQQVVYTMTNQGFLHAFDATLPASGSTGDDEGGAELFAFMPPGLLPNLPDVRDSARSGEHIYGLDGDITRWHDDINGDGKVNGNDTVMLVLGMRRGGGSYHAVDVTDPQRPKYLWRIDAGSTGFEHLAQTWSRASLISVKKGSGTERVLAFGGGYDALALDDTDARKGSGGNAIYLVDRDGNKLWSASGDTVAQMKYAIPSDLTPIDSDSDGLADRLYVGDTGGQLWRVDFDDVSNTSGFHVSRLADLDDGLHQPFFYPPSVAFNRGASGNYLSLAIGSGNRTQPLLTGTRNSFYVLRDYAIAKGKPDDPSLIESDDLFDTTDNRIASSDTSVAAQAASGLAEKRGWRVRLADGEKALSQLVSFEGKLLATTYEADTDSGEDECSFESVRRFYRMDLADGRPLATPGATDSTSSQRVEELEGRGIPSAPVVVFPPGASRVQVMVDKQVVKLFDQRLERVYWHSR